jgi:prophage antirepressor-like protein
MTEILSFKYGKNEVRTVTIDGEPWWVAKDVMVVLGYKTASENVNKILSRIDDDEKYKTSISSNKNPIQNFQNPVWCVSEPGLYSLILWSQIPEAKAFKRWITHEVIPQIRKTGGYRIPRTYADALQLAADQAKQLEAAKPAVEFYRTVTDSKDAIPMSQVAKVLDMGIGRNKLFSFLRERGVLMQDNEPYQEYIDNGWFRVVEQKYTRADGETRINIKTLVYQKGIEGIKRLLEEAA